MTIEQAVAILRQHNAWRRGAEITPCAAKEIGEAIDVLCDEAERLLRAAESANIREASHGR